MAAGTREVGYSAWKSINKDAGMWDWIDNLKLDTFLSARRFGNSLQRSKSTQSREDEKLEAS